MRIALLTQYYKPEMGAPQNRLYEMMTGLEALGNEVCVVTGMPNYPTGKIFDGYRSRFSMTEKIDGIEIRRYWLSASNSSKVLPRIWNMISFSITSFFSIGFLRKRKVDVLVVETPPLVLCITAYLITRLLGIRLVTNVSDLWPLSAKELGAISGDGMIYRMLERLERFIYRKSALCIGQSAQITEYMARHGAKDVYLFRNGVDPSRFENVPHQETGAFRIVYAGLLGFAQGIYDICRNINFKDLGVEFHIYGAGGEQELIESYLGTCGDRGIFFHGKVGRDEIPSVLAQADATLIPLVKNILGAVPSKIYESMAAGVPMVFSGEGEGEAIVREYDLGWVCRTRDYESMKQRIREFMDHPEDVERKRANCLRCAREVFNRPLQIAHLDNYLRSKFGKASVH